MQQTLRSYCFHAVPFISCWYRKLSRPHINRTHEKPDTTFSTTVSNLTENSKHYTSKVWAVFTCKQRDKKRASPVHFLQSISHPLWVHHWPRQGWGAGRLTLPGEEDADHSADSAQASAGCPGCAARKPRPDWAGASAKTPPASLWGCSHLAGSARCLCRAEVGGNAAARCDRCPSPCSLPVTGGQEVRRSRVGKQQYSPGPRCWGGCGPERGPGVSHGWAAELLQGSCSPRSPISSWVAACSPPACCSPFACPRVCPRAGWSSLAAPWSWFHRGGSLPAGASMVLPHSFFSSRSAGSNSAKRWVKGFHNSRGAAHAAPTGAVRQAQSDPKL